MLLVIDKARLQRLIAATRDDQRKADQGPNGPFYRMEASGQSLRLTGRKVEVAVSATVHEPGVVFLRVTLFRRFLALLPETGFVTIVAGENGLTFGDTRLSPSAVDMLLYPNPATAPKLHPEERGDMPEQIPPPATHRQLGLFPDHQAPIQPDD